MKSFVYRGYEAGGARARGIVEAHDLKDARERLSRSGVFPESVESADHAASSGLLRRSSSPLDGMVRRSGFYRALSALLEAGLPLVAALDIIIEQPEPGSRSDAGIIAGVRDRIRDGANLSRAMSDAGIRVSAFETAVMDSGERTGNMAVVLGQVADYLEEAASIRETLRTALIYPMVIIATALVVGIGVMGFLVPRMAAVFSEADLELPGITIAVVAAGRYFLPVGLPVLLLIAALILALTTRMRRDPAWRIRAEKAMARLPLLRDGFQLLTTARFARTFALLLKGGVPVIEAYDLSAAATGSLWLAGVARERADEVRHGRSFHDAIGVMPVIGSGLSPWARAGEAAGNLAGMMNHAAKRYRQLWAHYIDRMMKMVEPALIIAVALFVLLIALAILLPILSMNQQLQP